MYTKEPYEDGKLLLNDGEGYYLSFGKKDGFNKISLYNKHEADKPILVLNDLLLNGYYFRISGKAFGISYPDKEITLINPEYLQKGSKIILERNYYIFSVLHEIGHSILHKSNDTDFDRFKKEMQAWVWAIEKAKSILPEYFKTIDCDCLKMFIIKSLMDVKFIEK